MLRSRPRAVLALACGLFVATPTATVLAQTPAPAGDHPRTAAEYSAEGQKFYKSKNYERARKAFLAAYRLDPNLTTAWFLGVSEFESKHFVEALNHVRLFLRSGDPTPSEKKMADRIFPIASKQVLDVTVTAPSGMQIVVDDGTEPLTAPLLDPLALPPGKHTLKGTMNGRTTSTEVDGAAGTTASTELKDPSPPKPVEPVAPPQPEPAPIALAPVAANSEKQDDTPHHSAATRAWIAGSLGVGALALAGTGLYFTLASNSEANKATQDRQNLAPGVCQNPSAAGCTSLRQAADSANSDRKVSVVLYGAGAALAVGAVVSAFAIPTNHGGSVHAIVAPGVVGALWSSSF